MTDLGASPTDPRGVAAPEPTTIIHPRGFGDPTELAGEPNSGGRVYSTGVDRPGRGEPGERTGGRDRGDGPGGDQGAGRGRTTIADEVVEQTIGRIVDLAVAETDGVHGLHSGPRAGDGAVSVKLDGDQAEIDIAVDVEFGHAVHEAVDGFRAGLVGSAERLLGLTVRQVNVLVAGVAFGDPPGGTADAAQE